MLCKRMTITIFESCILKCIDLVWYTEIILSLELTYNGARDLYASMEQQIQLLNFKSKFSLLPSLNNPVYYNKAEVLKDPKHAVYRQLQ